MTIYTVNIAAEIAMERSCGAKPHRTGSRIAALLVRRLACDALKKHDSELVFETNEYGKPRLKGGGFFYNISHSGDYVAVAVHEAEVGVDIERIKDRDCLKLAKRFFTDAEYEWIAEAEHEERFYRLWTMKESYIKYRGGGLSIPLDSFSFSSLEENICAADDGTLCYTQRIFGEYFLTVCAEKIVKPEIRNVELDLLL